jgi:hypothetical protein
MTTVSFDLDGTLLDFEQAFTYKYTTWYNRPQYRWTEWDDVLTYTHFGTYRELFSWCDYAGVWNNMPYLPGAPGAVDALIRAGLNVKFVTARSTGAAKLATQAWFERSPWFDVADLAFSSTKLDVECDIWIDDSPKVIAGLIEAGHGPRVIVRRQLWNEGITSVFGSHDYDEIADTAIRLAENIDNPTLPFDELEVSA